MKIAVISASLGGCTPITPMVPQSVPDVTFHPFTEANFPLRPQALHPRMLAKIPKVFGYDLVRGHDAYIWIDASLTFANANAVQWFMEHLGDADAAFYRHPTRQTVKQEAAFVRERMPRSRRLMQRYLDERLDEQLAAIADAPDDKLYAAGAFVYRPTGVMVGVMKVWWEHMTRYHINDQLSLPYALWECGAEVHTINEDIFHSTHVRLRERDDEVVAMASTFR